MSLINQKERFHFLDGLRGIASLMIVIHHSLTAAIVKLILRLKIPFAGDFFHEFTQSGVDLFFVLSGVVLLRPYLRGKRPFETGDYFIRRLKRIYPPYFFALLFGAAVIWYMNTYPTWYNIRGMHQFFSWQETIREAFIFSFFGKYYNLAWWSLQIEVLFYIVVPVIVYCFPKPEKITVRRIVLTILITFVISFMLQHVITAYWWQLYYYKKNLASFGKFIEYPICFLMGIFLASKDFGLKQGYRMVGIGILLVATGVILVGKSLVFASVIHSGYGIFYAGIITLAFNVSTFKSFLSKPLLLWLGERSYSLFLIHFSVFYIVDNTISRFLTDRSMLYGTLTRCIGIPAAFFMAMLLFYFVERRQARGLVTGDAFWPWQVKKIKT